MRLFEDEFVVLRSFIGNVLMRYMIVVVVCVDCELLFSLTVSFFVYVFVIFVRNVVYVCNCLIIEF